MAVLAPIAGALAGGAAATTAAGALGLGTLMTSAVVGIGSAIGAAAFSGNIESIADPKKLLIAGAMGMIAPAIGSELKQVTGGFLEDAAGILNPGAENLAKGLASAGDASTTLYGGSITDGLVSGGEMLGAGSFGTGLQNLGEVAQVDKWLTTEGAGLLGDGAMNWSPIVEDTINLSIEQTSSVLQDTGFDFATPEGYTSGEGFFENVTGEVGSHVGNAEAITSVDSFDFPTTKELMAVPEPGMNLKDRALFEQDPGVGHDPSQVQKDKKWELPEWNPLSASGSGTDMKMPGFSYGGNPLTGDVGAAGGKSGAFSGNELYDNEVTAPMVAAYERQAQRFNSIASNTWGLLSTNRFKGGLMS